MPLPPNFGHWEHLQDMIRREHNKTVARYFKDVGGVDWEPDISTNRSALRTACQIHDKDTDTMTLIRLYLFYEVLGYGKKRLGNFYGMPTREFQESFEGKPEVFIYFSQDKDAVPDKFTPVDAEISFRLMNETSATITPAKAESLANAIKKELIEAGKGITFSKGKHIVSYTDKTNGYKFQVYSLTPTEGEKVIKQVMGIRNHVPDEEKIRVSTPKKNSVNVPNGTNLVYGKPQKKLRWRPVAKVRFRYAYLYIHGMEAIIPLVDTTGHWIDALVKV